MKAPCMDCQERSPYCHGRCERYKAFKEEKGKESAWRREQYVTGSLLSDIERKRARKLMIKARYSRR